MAIPSLMNPDSLLLPGERIDDLCRDGYQIIQNKENFCFGADAVFLSDFVSQVRKNAKVLDLGTGTGIIPILLKAKGKGAHFTALEIQPDVADMARRSVQLNGLEADIEIVDGDIKEASTIFGGASFDVVTTNPPYMKPDSGLVNPKSNKAISRHEIMCTLEDVIREASRVLKVRGRFFMIHRPNRLTEIFVLMQKYHLEPQRIQMIHPFVNEEATMVMIEGRKGCSAFMKVMEPIIMYPTRKDE